MGKCKFQEGDKVQFYNPSKGHLIGFIKEYVPRISKYTIKVVNWMYDYTDGEYHWKGAQYYKEVGALKEYAGNIYEFYGQNKAPPFIKLLNAYKIDHSDYRSMNLMNGIRELALNPAKLESLEKYISNHNADLDITYEHIRNIELGNALFTKINV